MRHDTCDVGGDTGHAGGDRVGLGAAAGRPAHRLGEPVIDAPWQAAQDERVDRLTAGWDAHVDRRARLRAVTLAAARRRDLPAARLLAVTLSLEPLLRPASPVVEAVLSPFDRATSAYVDFVDGRPHDAETQLTIAVVEHGRLAARHGLDICRCTQLHLCANIVRTRVARGDRAGAMALGDAVRAAAGDPAAWPFEDGPTDPWAALPEAVRAVLAAQLERALRGAGVSAAR